MVELTPEPIAGYWATARTQWECEQRARCFLWMRNELLTFTKCW